MNHSLEAHRRHDTAVILHLYYPEMWEGMRSYLAHLGHEFDLFLTAPHEVDLPESNIRASFADAHIYRCENRGRDIAPFLAVFRAISSLGFSYICKIHSKKSPHVVDGLAWQRDMLDKLLGSPKMVARIKQAFDKHPDWGLIAPAGHVVPLMRDSYHWGSNAEQVLALARSVGIAANEVTDLEFSFVAGSMFWFRPQAFRLLAAPAFVTEGFDPEEGKADGTLAHAMERFFGLVVDRSGFKIAESDSHGVRPSEVPFQLRLLLRQTQELDQRAQTLSRLLAEKEGAAQWALAELEQRRRDIDELTTRMTEGFVRESALSDVVANARAEAARQSKELSDAYEREAKVQGELDRAQERASLDHTRIEDLTRELVAVTDQLRATRADLGAAQTRSAADDVQIRNLTNQLHGVRTDLEAAQTRSAADGVRIQNLTDQLHGVRTDLEAAQARSAADGVRIQNLTDQLLASRVDLDAAKARSAADDARINNLTGKVAAAADRVHHMMGELSEAKERVAADESSISRLNAELAAVRQQLQGVAASKSWRWTAPLRTLDQVLRVKK